MSSFEFILYVKDQQRSRDFYMAIFGKPSLDVIGMTEFLLADQVKLGLMPEVGISKIITPVMPHPENGNGIPRCEIYIKSAKAEEMFNSAIDSGAIMISDFDLRSWGDEVAYVHDADGHVLAFAKEDLDGDKPQ